MALLVPVLAAPGLDVVAGDTISVTVRSGGAYASGRWVSSAPVTTAAIAATVQPATGRDLLRLPENRRNLEAVRVITRHALSVGDRAIGREADRVTFGTAVYETEHSASWSGVFVDAICVRVDE
jgi:hypothetical protein